MAWTYMTGVVEPAGNHFTTGPSSATQTNINELVPKAIRRIWRAQDQPYANAAQHAQMLVNNGKFVVPCLFDGAGNNSEFQALAPATCLTRGQQFANAMKSTCSVVEIVNEVFNSEHRVPPGPGGGKYWQIFRDLSDIFHAEGMQVLLSGVPNRLSFLDDCEAENMWSYADGVAIHCYFLNPGTNLTTAGTILRQLKLARDKIDAFGGAAVGLPLWMTEFGFVTKAPNPSGAGGNLLCTEAELTTKVTQAYTGFETYAETLKLRAATIFTWQDWTSTSDDVTPFKYSGIRTTEVGRYQTGPKGGSTADWDCRFGTQVAQDIDTIKPTLNGVLPAAMQGDPGAAGSLAAAPGRIVRYAQGIPTTPPTGAYTGFVRDAEYVTQILQSGKRPLFCLGIGTGGMMTGWTTAQQRALIDRWVNVLADAGLVEFEFANEPNSGQYAALWPLVRIASPIIRGRGGTVILGMTTGGGTPATLDAVQAAGDIFPLIDGVAVHPYDPSAAGALTKIRAARSKLVALGQSGKDIWITETGLGTNEGVGGTDHSSNLAVTEAQQASFITTLMNSLTSAELQANRIRAVVQFVYANYETNGDTSGKWDNWCGLLRRNGTKKPSWNAALAQGYSRGLAVPWYYKDGGAQSGSVGAKAALDAFGEGTVDVPGAAPEVVTLDPPNLIDQDSAVLTGTTDPNDLPTTYHYEYSSNPLPPAP